jgi:beta-galactosidase
MKSQRSFLKLREAASARGKLAMAALGLAIAWSASATVIPGDADYVRSLDGPWRFKLEHTNRVYEPFSEKLEPIDYPATFEPFYQTDYVEDAHWTNLAVPSNWEMAGFSPATYNNPDNASAFYRLWFDIPKSWQGRKVYVNFDGVQNGAEIWLNGRPVAVDEPSWGRENYHESGWTAWQADLTPQVNFGQKNLLALRVTKNTRSADLDSGDYFFLGGIYRPVTLFSVPQTHLADVTVRTHLLDGDRAEVKVIVEVSGHAAASVAMRLDGVPGQTTAKIEGGRAILTQIVNHPRLWSAEFPNLYRLTVDLQDATGQTTETFSRRIGIREITIHDGVLLVNGVPVKLAGICRHDISATAGSAVGPDLWRRDITMMKAANINAIRTSHYPYGSGFYDLCDELGMYVVDELPYCWCSTNELNSPEMLPAFEQRARETIRRDKNHPCVILWTIGNENGAGRNLQAVADLVKQLDPTRPRDVSCFDAAQYHTELSDSHYWTPRQMEQAVARSQATGAPHIYLEDPNTWEIRRAADPGAWEHWGAVLQRTWAVAVTNDTIPGIFLWEWQDRAVADRCPTKLYFYFPDTGIQLLKIKGLVDGYRNPRPWLYDVKMIYSPVQIGNTFSLANGKISFPVDNRYSFTDLADLKMAWTLERAGRTIASGNARVNLPPRHDGTAEVSLPADALASADSLRVAFVHSDGQEVIAHRFTLKEIPPTSRLNPTLPANWAVPQFNLITRLPARRWDSVPRFPAHLANVVLEPPTAATLAAFRQLDADVIGGAHDRVVGRLHAQFDHGQFSYRLRWTGPRSEVQELGWKFTLPADCDHFSWDRAARWTIYPAPASSAPAAPPRRIP